MYGRAKLLVDGFLGGPGDARAMAAFDAPVWRPIVRRPGSRVRGEPARSYGHAGRLTPHGPQYP